MSRIKHDTPMKAYDHIANLLTDAGGADGVVSRADAKKLVKDLRKQGRGTEALAANNLFKMIDARDAKAGNKVTGYDLAKDRSFVEAKMLENRDPNGNGFSKAEVAKMSPTGRALVELGQMLEIEAAKGRVAHETPRRGLFHVAGLLRQAAKGDLVLSRADVDAMADKLAKQGRGNEANALRTFGTFIDFKDAKKGAKITDADITKAVDYAEKELLRDYDTNNNGYSKSEIAKMSTSGKAFVLIGQMVDAGVLDSAMPTKGKDVRATLAGLVKEQTFDQMGSEGGQRLRAVHRAGKFQTVDLKSFREAFDMPNKPIQVVDKFTADDLRQYIEVNSMTYDPQKGAIKDPQAADAAFGATAILRSLKDLKVFVTGQGDQGLLPTYIVGRAPDGSMVGLQTSVVWT